MNRGNLYFALVILQHDFIVFNLFKGLRLSRGGGDHFGALCCIKINC